MSTTKLSNITIAEFEAFLSSVGCVKVESGNTGHYKWKKPGCIRSIVFQTHIEPIPEPVISSNLRSLEIPKKQLRDWLRSQHKKEK
jgi:hypothetical protein